MFWNSQVIQDLTAYHCLFDDPRHVRCRHATVPDSLRVDHDSWAKFALIQTTCLIGANQWSQPSLTYFGLEEVSQCLGTVAVTAAPRMIGGPLVTANKDMVSKCCHGMKVASYRNKRSEVRSINRQRESTALSSE
jgi:hypothetical protein